jgi:Cu/Ag efflux protein CusF
MSARFFATMMTALPLLCACASADKPAASTTSAAPKPAASTTAAAPSAATTTAAATNPAAAAADKPSGSVGNVVEARATVIAVDPVQRKITLQEPQGDQLELEVTDAVKNLAQVQPGDEVVISYAEALAWNVKPAGQGTPGVTTAESAATAKPGEKPGAAAGRSVTLTTTITSIDVAQGTVTLTGPDGGSRTIKARDPANLNKVQVGDLVDITYTEAVALDVRRVEK